MKRIKVVKEKKVKEVKERKKLNIRKILPVFAVIIVVAVILAWALPMLPARPQNKPSATYKGVVELWNVEAFEGGSGSRSSWITKRAAKFEQSREGLFVHVTDLTMEQMQRKLADGQTFDMICFSRGAGFIVKDKLAAIDDCGTMGNFSLSGQLNGEQLAVPLYCGLYCLFSRTSQLSVDNLKNNALTATYTRKIGKNTIELQPMICGFTPYNSPLSAMAMSGCKGSAKVDETVTQYQAYEWFVANKTAVTLLGTQRDLYRLNKKMSDGKIEEIAFCPLQGYTDLVQYLGIADCGEKKESCIEFCRYLLSEDAQRTLVNVNMFSPAVGIYTDEKYALCEQALKQAYVPNVFGDEQSIQNQRKTAIGTLNM